MITILGRFPGRDWRYDQMSNYETIHFHMNMAEIQVRNIEIILSSHEYSLFYIVKYYHIIFRRDLSGKLPGKYKKKKLEIRFVPLLS